MLKAIIFCAIALMAYDCIAQGQGSRFLQQEYQVHIAKTKESISIDGNLQESTWKSADKADNFWMSSPIDDRRVETEFQTEVMLTYDDKYLYIAAICHGNGPHVMPSLKRDAPNFWSGDVFSIIIDPVNQQTNSFAFGVNTEGVQFEALGTGQTGRRGSNGGSGINVAWDNIWISEVEVYEDYWTAEIAIPFKTIRFDDKNVWGINFIRGHSGTNSFHTWSPVPVQFRGFDLGYTGALIWDKPPVRAKSNISVIPYVLASNTKDIAAGADADNTLRVGGDAKVALTSTLNLDLTINPDFSQVEVDQQVTNLDRFEIFFPFSDVEPEGES